jgi:hypothetical protein
MLSHLARVQSLWLLKESLLSFWSRIRSDNVHIQHWKGTPKRKETTSARKADMISMQLKMSRDERKARVRTKGKKFKRSERSLNGKKVD